MSTIDWPEGESQTYVITEDGMVRVDGDHADTGQRSAVYDVPAARARAAAHRALADAIDTAADHLTVTRVSAAFAALERLLVAEPDMDAVKAAAANVRALIEETETGEPQPWAAMPAPAADQVPVIT
jgi:hypothetical protein